MRRRAEVTFYGSVEPLALRLEFVGEPIDLGSCATDDPKIVNDDGQRHGGKHKIHKRYPPKTHEVQKQSKEGCYRG